MVDIPKFPMAPINECTCVGKALGGPLDGKIIASKRVTHPVPQLIKGKVIGGEYRFDALKKRWNWYGPKEILRL